MEATLRDVWATWHADKVHELEMRLETCPWSDRQAVANELEQHKGALRALDKEAELRGVR